MDKNLKAKWVEALRSGDFTQLTPGGMNWRLDGKHCCLGVLGELTDEQAAMDGYDFGSALSDKYGIDFEQRCHLIDMNDIHHKSFDEIADWIEAHL